MYELSNKKGNVIRNKIKVNHLKRYIKRSDTMDGKPKDKMDGDNGGENEIDKENGGDIERNG